VIPHTSPISDFVTVYLQLGDSIDFIGVEELVAYRNLTVNAGVS
jgi:hypothetical protein